MAASCPICGSHMHVLWTATSPRTTAERTYLIATSVREKPSVARCDRCGHGVSQTPPVTAISAWYANAEKDTSYLREEEGRRRTAREMLRRIGHGGSLLDLGAGPGFLVDEARKQGWSARGMEVARWAVDEARSRGISVNEGSIEDLSVLPGASWDAVTLIDVIEHLTDPNACIREVVRLLKPGGSLLIVTPQFDSLPARILGRRWYCVMPAHLHYFSRSSLDTVLESIGCERVSCLHHTRHFRLSYLLERLGLRRIVSWLPKLKNLTFPVRLFDTMEVVAKKS